MIETHAQRISSKLFKQRIRNINVIRETCLKILFYTIFVNNLYRFSIELLTRNMVKSVEIKKKNNFEINYKKREKQKNEYGGIYLERELLARNLNKSIEKTSKAAIVGRARL